MRSFAAFAATKLRRLAFLEGMLTTTPAMRESTRGWSVAALWTPRASRCTAAAAAVSGPGLLAAAALQSAVKKTSGVWAEEEVLGSRFALACLAKRGERAAHR